MGAFNLQQSFASLNARRVATACGEYLAARERKISGKRARLIDAEMQRFFLPPKDREAAVKRLKNKGAFGEYHWAQDKIDDVCNGDKKHREEKACERRLKQMAARREKEAVRQARKVGAGDTATETHNDQVVRPAACGRSEPTPG